MQKNPSFYLEGKNLIDIFQFCMEYLYEVIV